MATSQRNDCLLLTKPESADLLRISVRKLEKEIAAGAIATTRIGTRHLIPREELLRYVADRTAIEDRVRAACPEGAVLAI